MKAMNPCTLQYSTDELIAYLGEFLWLDPNYFFFPPPASLKTQMWKASSKCVCICVYSGYKADWKPDKKSSEFNMQD